MIPKLTQSDKQQIAATIQKAIIHHKSASRVAAVCSVSEATISQMVKMKYQTQGDDMWLKVKAALDQSPGTGWVIAETRNHKDVVRILQLAKTKGLWLPISEKAGAGKTTATKWYFSNDNSQSIFRMECRKWGRKEFLHRLCRTLGINPDSGRKTHDELIEEIADFFKMRSLFKPQLIIDQANSLKPAALISLIYLYNECEGLMSCVILGTENLEKVIKRGVKYGVDGFDELDSRVGRNYLHLPGFTLHDVMKICDVNGLSDKGKQKEIFEECKPIHKLLNEGAAKQQIRVVEDGRRIKRCIERELMRNELN